jgi:hypothetical protein
MYRYTIASGLAVAGLALMPAPAFALITIADNITGTSDIGGVSPINRAQQFNTGNARLITSVNLLLDNTGTTNESISVFLLSSTLDDPPTVVLPPPCFGHAHCRAR